MYFLPLASGIRTMFGVTLILSLGPDSNFV